MEDEAPLIYGLEFQARTLCAQAAETDQIRFLVGTQSLKFDNQIHQLEYDEETNTINKNVYLHKDGELWHMSANPKDKNIIATCYNKVTAESTCMMESALWRFPDDCEANGGGDDTSTLVPALEQLCKLKCDKFGKEICCAIWHPSEDNQLITVVDNNLLMWNVAGNASAETSPMCGTLTSKGQPKFMCGCWSPHQNYTQFATANDTHIRSWDLRTMQQCWCIENAHAQLIRDLDFNPNKQYYLASCGDDCYVKFWDIRSAKEPVLALNNHSHWVWSVRFNHFHDQLVVSASSDSHVILTSVASISSEPYGHLLDEDGGDEEDGEKMKPSRMADGVIAAYDEHEDSVYAVEWSTADPWTFASLSYDGRLVINRVPRSVKYKILL